MIKVGFDISQVAHLGGVATYTKNLAEGLLKEKDLEIAFFYSSLRKPYKGRLKNVKSFKLPPTLFEVLFNNIRNVGIERFVGSIDVFHSSDWVQPPTKAKKVTTYHDVIPLKYPQWSHPKVVAVHKRRLRLVEKEIDCVIAVSKSTKKDLMEISNIPEEKITVIYEAASDDFRILEKEEVEEFRKSRGLPNKFVLAIGGVGEIRNLERVRKACKDIELVILGETINNLNTQELVLLYNASSVLLYPSFYAGFGLPILEAMACGIPVITSNLSSMPEVGGEAALYVDPKDQSDIDQKLKKVLEDEGLRKEVVRQGLSQAKKFSWEKCAKETADVYRRLMNENSH